MPDRAAGRERRGGRDNRVRVDAIVPVEVRYRAGLAEMLDAERTHPVAGDCAEPGERRRVAVKHGDDPRMRRHFVEHLLDMGAGMGKPAFAGALRRRPAGIEPVGGGNGEQPNVAAVFRHQPYRLNRFRRDRTRIGHHHLAVWPRLAKPISAVNDLSTVIGRERPLRLFDRTGREPQVNRSACLLA